MIEKEILGQCLVDEKAADTALSMLTTNDFSNYENKEVFKTLNHLRAQGKAADALTVASIYKNVPYIYSLSENIATTRQIKQHCELLKDRSLKGQIIKKISDIATHLNQLTSSELLEELQGIVNKGESNSIDTEIRDLDTVPYKGIAEVLNKFIPTGMPTIDHAINDLVGGYVTLIAGRNNGGKTTFCNQIIANAIEKNFKVLVVNGEEKQETAINKLYTAIIGRNEEDYDLIHVNKRLMKEPTPAAIKDLQAWHKNKLKIFSKGESNLKTTEQLFALMKREIKNNKQDLIVLDNLMSLLMVESVNEKNGKQADFMQKCCDLAKEQNVHIIVVVHPNKTYRKGEEMDSEQISGTSDLANKADNVITVVREYDDNILEAGINGYIQVVKNRGFSNLPKVSVHFEESTGLLLEINLDESEIIGYSFRWKSHPDVDSNNDPYVATNRTTPFDIGKKTGNKNIENGNGNEQKRFFIDN
jgi:replicative DNA helicase